MNTNPGFYFIAFLGLALSIGASLAAVPVISDNPLFLVSGGQGNLLMILDNSNSMDEAPDGSAVGSNSSASKSEIARTVIRTLIGTYNGKVNMGLMGYKQNSPYADYLHNSPYDASYDPADYNPTGACIRSDPHCKKFRIPNPTSTGDYIHFNVELPFYDSRNQGYGFCYSTTACTDLTHDFKGTAESSCASPEDPISGPWDSYRCYSIKTGPSNDAPTDGYSNPMGTYTFSPTDSDLAQGITDFGKRMSWSYVSRAWFRNDSPGRGYLYTPIKALDTTQATALNAKLACNIPGTPSPCTSSGIANAGLTPIEGTLLTAKDYFSKSWTTTSEGYVSGSGSTSSYPLPTSCGKDFVVLLTDGLPDTNKNGSVVADPATAIAQAATAAAALKTAGVETYVVGFALPYGVDPTSLDTIAAAGGTNTAYSANDPATLSTALSAIFNDILSKTTSAAAISANSTRLNTQTLIYQARFNSGEWSGQIIAFKLNTDGSLGTKQWDTDTTMASITPSSRKVWTWDGTVGASFAWANLSCSQKGYLSGDSSATIATNCAASSSYYDGNATGQNRLNWLRGQAVTGMRSRSKILGDIINSDPAFVSAENFGYSVHPDADAGGEGYQQFLTTKESRKKMLYVGANDGMVHAFDADTGAEQFSYVPAGVYANLSKLTDPGYSHRYFVDGSPIAWDACIGPAGSFTSSTGTVVTTSCTWRTVLLGSLGAGGQTIYALDITDPTNANFGKPLWEFSHNDLGALAGSPQVIKLQSGDWAAIFGNGYRSKNCEDLLGGIATGNCNAKLFAVNLKTGALLSGFPIDTGAGSATNPNGIIGPPALYDVSTRILGDESDSGTSLGDGIYAGDLQGNLWRFNYKSGWQIAYGTTKTPAPLFIAKDSIGNLQPITAPLEIGDPPVSGQGAMLYFGTGTYFSTTDTTNKAIQTFYGIWDQGVVTSSDRTKLQQQTIDTETTAFGRNVRLVSNNTITWSGTGAKQGWYMDLLSPDKIARGERVVSAPLLRFGRVIFNTLIPSTDPCSAGGTSWLMEVDALSGGRLGYTVFDLNKDTLFNAADYVSNTPVSGLASMVGITKTPAVVSAGAKEYKVQTGTDLSGANQGLLITTEKGGTPKPRGAWRQLFQN